MYRKVEISGINTSALKLLSEAEKTRLLERVAAGDRAARDELVNGNLKLVLSVVQRFMGRGEDPDDLFQVGCIGLMKAVDNFDLSYGLRFSTYAVPMILGELRRHMRDTGALKVSRSIKDLAYRVMLTRDRLTGADGSEPTVDETARELGVERTDVVMALESVCEPLSFDEPIYGGDDDCVLVMDRLGSDGDENDWLSEISVRESIARLPARERRILYLRFMLGKTQVDVSKEIGISQAQVSRLEKNAIEAVKKSL